MKILWVNPNFLHPTTKGGQIRTLEIVKRLHRRHEVHYVAYENSAEPEGPARAAEYSTRAYPVEHRVPSKQSAAFAAQIAGNVFSSLPLAVTRWQSPRMRTLIDELRARERFDSVVCDFLFPAPNFSRLDDVVLFQHNVESTIWQRHYETARGPARRWLFKVQADRMLRYEREICRAVRHVIAVSDIDARRMEQMFGLAEVSSTPTGVDVEYFAPPAKQSPEHDIVFVGSMDWMPNIDGVTWFAREILPRIRERRPQTTLAVVGRTPTPAVLELGRGDSRLTITGTVKDVRPYFWGSTVCVVPLRVGGGTRLKIYEAMAARIPVVSTTIGAEGLPLHNGEHLLIADEPDAFAGACLRLLENAEERNRLAHCAWQLVSSRFSWEQVTGAFEQILVTHSAR